MYDVIVIGARCAGAPTAMLLARAGRRVLLVDRATFPSDTLSTHFIQPQGVARLIAWGLYDRVKATGAPDLAPTMHAFGMSFPAPPPDVAPIAPRRTVLDAILVDAAREAGADVQEGFSVQELTRDAEGRVTGIRGRARDGASVNEQAAIVVGADGRNSFVARSVGAHEYQVHPPTSCGYYTYVSGLTSGAELHLAARHAFFIFPTNDEQACIALEAPISAWNAYRADPEAYVRRITAQHMPDLAARLEGARVEERWYGMQGRRSFFRKPYGPGWALVGDAAYLKDPITGKGIDDAFRDAEDLARAIDAGLSGVEPMEQALAAHQQRRDEASMASYEATCAFAKMEEVTPEMLALWQQAVAPPMPETTTGEPV